MASIESRAKPGNEDALDSVRSIIEREFKPRPGQADMIAPNGKAYLIIRTKPSGTAIQALQELGGRLRALIGEYQGDTVWWRRKPELQQEDMTKFWTARASLALGYASTERAEFMPDDENPAAYPDDGKVIGTTRTTHEGLPRWKCHKVVEAAKITGLWFRPTRLVLRSDACAVELSDEVFARLCSMVKPRTGETEEWTGLVGGYYVRYPDGYESWSPAKAFEDGYTKIVS